MYTLVGNILFSDDDSKKMKLSQIWVCLWHIQKEKHGLDSQEKLPFFVLIMTCLQTLYKEWKNKLVKKKT